MSTARSAAGTPEAFGETVALGALFPCAAVAAELLRAGGVAPRFGDLLACARQLEEAATGTEWERLTPADEMRSGIVLLRSTRPGVRSAGAEELRRHFQAQSIALTAYDGGTIRLSAAAARARGSGARACGPAVVRVTGLRRLVRAGSQPGGAG